MPEHLIPCSDMAGEVIAAGDDAGSEWKTGDRVCANFAADHIAGETTLEIQKTAYGGSRHGVLTQYKSFRPHVRVSVSPFRSGYLVLTILRYAVYSHLLGFPSTFRLKRPVLCRKYFPFTSPSKIERLFSVSRCAALTAYSALTGPTPVKSGDTVLILGTGGVSMCIA